MEQVILIQGINLRNKRGILALTLSQSHKLVEPMLEVSP
jgi:hypothetical protein